MATDVVARLAKERWQERMSELRESVDASKMAYMISLCNEGWWVEPVERCFVEENAESFGYIDLGSEGRKWWYMPPQIRKEEPLADAIVA